MGKRRARGEGSVYFSEKQNLWVGKITLPDGKRKVKYGKTQKEVKNWVLEVRKTLKDGLYIEPSKMTIGELLDRWFSDIAAPQLRESTIQTHETIIRVHLKPAFGDLLLNQLTPLHLTSLYAEKLKSGLSKRTVKYMHTIMHQSLGQALKWGLVARNVTDSVDAPIPDKKKVQPLTKGQVATLLKELENDRLFALLCSVLGVWLAARRGACIDKRLHRLGNKPHSCKKNNSKYPGQGSGNRRTEVGSLPPTSCHADLCQERSDRPPCTKNR